VPILLDFYALLFIRTVRVIRGSVILFSKSYIAQEKFFWRFHGILVLFIIRIFLLILSPHAVRVLLGWDGLGVTSYLLVIYFQRRKSFNAGIITALRNRVGDVLILRAMAFIASSFTWNFGLLAQSQLLISSPLIVLLLRAACTKRAQLPFSAWLPAAIAAPTPVSRLVHSSTLVTAGVYLVFRLSYFTRNRGTGCLLLFLGFLTILMAGLAALVEADMKKIIALSTLRQLGVIMLTLGGGRLEVGYYHMISHAFLKALLFITIGAIIHRVKDYQDIRKSSVLPSFFPLTLAFNLIANLRLCGFPFTSGFYSKDIAIEFFGRVTRNIPLSGLLFFATGLTALYTIRLLRLTLIATSKLNSLTWSQDKDKYINKAIPLLFFLRLVGANWLKWIIFFAPTHFILPIWLKNTTLLTIFVIGIRAVLFFPQGLAFTGQLKKLFFLWGLPFFTSQILRGTNLRVGKQAFFSGDLTWNPLVTLARLNPDAFWFRAWRQVFKLRQILQGLGVIFLILIRIFLYLYVINFFIFFSFKN